MACKVSPDRIGIPNTGDSLDPWVHLDALTEIRAMRSIESRRSGPCAPVWYYKILFILNSAHLFYLFKIMQESMSICWSYSTSKHLQSKPLGMIACCGQLIECVLVYGSSDSMMGMHFTKWVAIVWNKTFFNYKILSG